MRALLGAVLLLLLVTTAASQRGRFAGYPIGNLSGPGYHPGPTSTPVTPPAGSKPPVNPQPPANPALPISPSVGFANRGAGFRPGGRDVPVPYAVPYPVPVGASYGAADVSPDQSAVPQGDPFISEMPAEPDPYAPLEWQPAMPAPFPPQPFPQSAAAQPPLRGCDPSFAEAPPKPRQASLPQYLIALKDHWVHAAVAYWVQGPTLHYVTPEGDHNQISLSLVDRQTSARLNADAPDTFALPPQ